MNLPKLYRRRYIPNETIYLKDDNIIEVNNNYILTTWNVLKPRKDMTHGISCYYINKGYKISNIYNNNSFVYTYCDIIETIHNKEENSYTINDLLVDVIIYENGFVKVMDISELSEALDLNLLTIDKVKKSLNLLDSLLDIIYSGKLNTLTDILTFTKK